MTARPLLLIDAPSLYFRAFFGVPPRAAPDGTPVNAVAGFVDWTARLIEDRDPGRLACVMDLDWRPAFRVELIPSYKTHRLADADAAEQAEPDELSVQVPVIESVMEAAGVAVLGCEGYEADDVIATLAHRESPPVEIVTGDRDLFQLVRDPDVLVLYPRKGVTVMDRVDEGWVRDRYAIPGRAYADMAILRGDTSDGLPGVRGIGDKTASQLIATHGSLEGVVAASEGRTSGPLAKVKAARDYLDAAARVVRLPTDLAIPSLDLTRPRVPADETALTDLARRYGIAGPVKRLVESLAGPH